MRYPNRKERIMHALVKANKGAIEYSPDWLGFKDLLKSKGDIKREAKLEAWIDMHEETSPEYKH